MSERRSTMDAARIIDSHIHCGIQCSHLPFEGIAPLLDQAGITDACLFAPVEDIYDRDDFHFEDTAEWRRIRCAANHYLLDLADRGESIFPYLFVWNDFALEELQRPYRGIKWHRHTDEPEYHYDDPRCAAILAEITRRQLPVVLEESYANTLRFIRKLAPEAVIIIPHLGALNGSYRALEQTGIWKLDNVYADSALATTGEMRHFLEHYGPDKLLFGSDFPFGDPGHELRKITRLGLSPEDFNKVVCGNILGLFDAAEGP